MYVPKLLFKYRDFENKIYLDMFNKSELYLPSPNEFDDTNDCNLDEYIPEIDGLENEYLNHLPEKLRNANGEEKIKYAEHMVKYGLMANHQATKEYIEKRNREHNSKRGVLCLSKRFNIDYMWEKYGGIGKHLGKILQE